MIRNKPFDQGSLPQILCIFLSTHKFASNLNTPSRATRFCACATRSSCSDFGLSIRIFGETTVVTLYLFSSGGGLGR